MLNCTEMLRTIVATAALSLSSAAGAATLCVDADKPGTCHVTIQGAIDDADAGDKIKLASGTYFENLLIPAGKNGLRIEGKRSAVLDAGDDGGAMPNTNRAILVGSANVRLDGFTIRGGEDHHVEMVVGTEGLHLKDLYSQNPGGRFLSAPGNNSLITVEDCEIAGVEQTAIRISGSGAIIEDNEIRGAGDGGIHVQGLATIIEGNKLSNIEGAAAIGVEGGDTEIVKNEIRNVADHAIYSLGDDALVSKNEMTTGYVFVGGEGVVVEKNELENASQDSVAYMVNCFNGCATTRVSKNDLDGTGPGMSGLVVSGADAGARITKNDLRRISAYGLASDVIAGAEISKNRIRDVAFSSDESCLAVDGDDFLVEDNEVVDCGTGGIAVFDGDNNRVLDNRATRPGRFGYIALNGTTGTLFEDNRSKYAAVAGFTVTDASVGTMLRDNKASKNRFDLCDDASSTDFEDNGNNFEEILDFDADGTDDCPSR